MGMTYEQFWYGESSMVIPYRKAFQIRQEEQNYLAWLNGLYICKALASVPQFVNGFVPKGARIEPYFDKPIEFKPAAAQSKEEEKEQLKQNAVNHMTKLASIFNKQFARKREAEQRQEPPGKE